MAPILEVDRAPLSYCGDIQRGAQQTVSREAGASAKQEDCSGLRPGKAGALERLRWVEARKTAHFCTAYRIPDLRHSLECSRILRVGREPAVKARFELCRALRPVQAGEPGSRFGPRRI